MLRTSAKLGLHAALNSPYCSIRRFQLDGRHDESTLKCVLDLSSAAWAKEVVANAHDLQGLVFSVAA